MLLEIIAGRSEVTEIRSKDSHQIVALKQECYAHLPGAAFPVQCKIRVDRPLQPGKYEAELPFKIGRWGDIEVNPFESPRLTPAKPEQVKAAS
ncbi:MAG: hypothetical protein QW786_03925 [Candidatus Hadarchaeum sp.]